MSAPPALTSPLLDLPGLRHGFFTRKGGVSQGIYAGLNVGAGSNDDPSAVQENRRRAAGAFGVASDRLATNYQVHSARAVVIGAEAGLAAPRREADALVSALPGVMLGALAADCAPVLMVDPKAHVVAAVHAGWRGALDGVIEAAVAAMTGPLPAVPARIVAVVGPCIGPASYEVGLEFLDTFEAGAPGSGRFFSEGAAEACQPPRVVGVDSLSPV